jgi:hypothetical protein
MIIVRVELHSAVTGRVTELARMMIHNVGVNDTGTMGDYEGIIYTGRSKEQLDLGRQLRSAPLLKHARQQLHVWNLVSKMLVSLGYKTQGN